MTLQEKIAENGHIKHLILFITLAMFATAIVACGSNESIPNPTPTLAEPIDFPAGFPTPDPEILADCLANGGRWEVLGFSGPGCNLPTSDGGEACQDSEECESGCLGDPDLVMSEDEFGNLILNQELAEKLNAANEVNLGICSPWKGNFGCQMWVENGRYVAICVD